ncbi:hypothetical protein HYDPIDRAFT_44725 [Hydnomerulius pinastri MD-312]|uniref:Uncharacterized protein n=1 Tax=Hydnomerulius pinastri MD-312 TaxID=994086 RepID=A0A0C9UXX3_9AGAM|nr:hypothetical protein HYDPIDRAFT_44725 [Hydnomerulius pinastri MD-312]
MQIGKYIRLPSTVGEALPKYVPRFMRYGPWIAMLFAVLAMIIMAVKITTAYVLANFSSAASVDLVNNNDGSLQGVVLLANVWSIDTDAGTMSIHWSVMGGCGENFTFQRNSSCVENGFNLPMNLYLNLAPSSAWHTTPPAGTYSPQNILDPPPAYYIPERELIPTTEFDTILPMDQFLPYTQDKTSTTLYYPFDIFKIYVSMVAINPTDNSTIPIAFASGYVTVVNWVGEGDFQCVQPPGEDRQYALILTQERQLPVKAFVIVILATNWIMSITVLWMTILVLFHQNLPSGLLLASTAILFALPQIRASMPDAPPFGALIGRHCLALGVRVSLRPDIGGYFMNVCLVSVCTSTLLLSQLRYRCQPPPNPSQDLSGETQPVQITNSDD